MACLAVPWLLLAMTLSLLWPSVAPALQPELNQAGGQSRQQLDQENGVRECIVNNQGYSSCSCLSGYQWNAKVCSSYPSCHHYDTGRDSCGCLKFTHLVPGYCQLLPPVPANLTLGSQLQMPGDMLNLTLMSQEATKPSWFLKRPGFHKPIFLWPGRQVFSTISQGQAGLIINNMSHFWTGKYISIFEAQGFRWELHQEVQMPLTEKEVIRLPDQLSISCATSSGFQLNCCIPRTSLAYSIAWSPRDGSLTSLHNTSHLQCLVLAVQHCPSVDTTYACVLESQDLAPLMAPVSVTIIQDGDTTCPENFSVVAWNVTKAGYMAQAPCPMNKIGVVKRHCGSGGAWGPIQSNCIEERILTLFYKAQLLLAGQGQPAVEVPQILRQLQEQVEVASTPSELEKLLHIVTLLAEVVEEAGTQLDHNALKDLLITTDKLLDMDISSLWTMAQAQKASIVSDFLQAVETLAHSLRPQHLPFSFNSSNVWLQSQLFISTPTLTPGYQIPFSTWPLLQAQISWHSLAPLVHNGNNISITSLVLQKLDHILPSNIGQWLENAQYSTPGLILVISIMADGQAFTQAEVIMDFEDMNGTGHCVFWNHNLFQGQGGWSDEGCQAQAASASPTTRCICQHLTAFSILMSQHTMPKDLVLDLLGQVGLGASILALLVCLGVYRLVWRVVVRNKVAFFRHAALFNMVICLLAADTCFLGVPLLPPEYRNPLCLATTFLCHFFYLATFFWMLAQALVLAHQLLFVFHQLSKHIVLSLMVILGYLCPLGFAGVTLGLYLPQERYLWKGKCWLNGEEVLLYTFSGPVLTIVSVNGLVLAIVVLKLLRPSLSEGPPVEKRQALLGVLKALLVLTPVFGLTWGLGVVTLLDQFSTVSHYLFTILNSLQGVFILVFGCLSDKKVREALWKHFSHTQPSGSAISLATNETYISEHGKGTSANASYEERMADRNL